MGRPDFEKQQMQRCLKAKDVRGSVRREEEEKDGQFKKPRMMEKSNRGGSRGGRDGGKMPGWKKNPGSYTKYSLADVPDVSNSSYAAAAFDFLNKLKKDREEAETPADLNQK